MYTLQLCTVRPEKLKAACIVHCLCSLSCVLLTYVSVLQTLFTWPHYLFFIPLCIEQRPVIVTGVDALESEEENGRSESRKSSRVASSRIK